MSEDIHDSNNTVPHVTGRCKTCGYVFDLNLGLDCPDCRALAIAEAYRPRDAKQYERLNPHAHTCADLPYIPCDACDWVDAGKPEFRSPMPMPKSETEGYRERLEEWQWQLSRKEETESVPKECKIPLGEAGQVYELKRLFRL